MAPDCAFVTPPTQSAKTNQSFVASVIKAPSRPCKIEQNTSEITKPFSCANHNVATESVQKRKESAGHVLSPRRLGCEWKLQEKLKRCGGGIPIVSCARAACVRSRRPRPPRRRAGTRPRPTTSPSRPSWQTVPMTSPCIAQPHGWCQRDTERLPFFISTGLEHGTKWELNRIPR